MAEALFLAIFGGAALVCAALGAIDWLIDPAFQLIEHRWGWRWEGLDR